MEVAEALFDLARMFTQPPPSESKASESKGEAKVSAVNEVKSEAKQETKASGGGSGSSLPPQAPNGGGIANEVKAGGASGAGGAGGVRGSSPGAGSAASPAPSSPAPGAGAAPVAEGMWCLWRGGMWMIVWYGLQSGAGAVGGWCESGEVLSLMMGCGCVRSRAGGLHCYVARRGVDCV